MCIRDSPMSAVRALRAISADEIARRKAALALHRADVLYDLRDSRAGDHFLAEVAEHCLPNLLPELAAERDNDAWLRKMVALYALLPVLSPGDLVQLPADLVEIRVRAFHVPQQR